jgi:hypothetical protein
MPRLEQLLELLQRIAGIRVPGIEPLLLASAIA